MTAIDALRAMFANLYQTGIVPSEVEVRVPAAVVRVLADSIDTLPFASRREVVTSVERLGTPPWEVGWIRIYEPWGCICIRSLEGK